MLSGTAGVLIGRPAVAQDADGPDPTPLVADELAQEPDGWSFTVAPYLWVLGIDGHFGVRGVTQSFSADIDDILDRFDIGATLRLEAQRDRFLILGELAYLDLGNSVDTDILLGDAFDLGTVLDGVELNVPTLPTPGVLPPALQTIVQQLIADQVMEVTDAVEQVLSDATGPRLDGVEADAKFLIVELAGGYHLGYWDLGGSGYTTRLGGDAWNPDTASFDGPVLSVTALAGARYVRFDSDLKLSITPGVLDMVPSRITKSATRDWIDPFIGGRLQLALSDELGLFARGDVGGFGVGSDLTWGFTGGVKWKLDQNMNLVAGYRILDIDYEDGGGVDKIELDAQLAGPFLSVAFSF